MELVGLHAVRALASLDPSCGRAKSALPLGTFLPQLLMGHINKNLTAEATSSATKIPDFARPTYEFAKSIGLSTSVRGWIILNKKNWSILQPFLERNTKSVRGTFFDGSGGELSASYKMTDRQNNLIALSLPAAARSRAVTASSRRSCRCGARF